MKSADLGVGGGKLILSKLQWKHFKSGRLIFIHLQCWEVLPFCRFQRQRCIKIRVFRAQDFYTSLALKTAKGQHLPQHWRCIKICLSKRSSGEAPRYFRFLSIVVVEGALKVVALSQGLQPPWTLFGSLIWARMTPKKSRKKGCRGLSAPLSERLKKQVEKGLKRLKKRLFFESFSTFCRLFSNRFLPWGREAPGTLFDFLLGFRARRARVTPVRGQGGCKSGAACGLES